MKSRQSAHDRQFILRVIYAGFFSALATFMQPRWILTSIVIAALWAIITKGRKAQALILVGVVGIMALAPAIMIQRNIQSIDKAVISTNLGVTMNIGAGPETSGGYNKKGPGIKCPSDSDKQSASDNDLVKCVLIWYAKNPTKTIHLSLNKSIYFWSPWSGPIANGTMARNPWLKINPVVNIANGSEQGNQLVYGTVGKLVSWAWLIGGVFLFFYGFVSLRRSGTFEKQIAALFLFITLISWITTLGTIGDHRFRIPTMSMSLVLQFFGLWRLKEKMSKN